MLKKSINIVICLLIFILIVDPGDLIFHLKMPLFALIFLIWFSLKTSAPILINKDILYISFFFLVIPLFGICMAIIQHTLTDYVFALGFVKSFLILTLLVVIVDLKVPIEKYLNILCIAIPLIIIPVYILFTNNPNSIASIYSFFNEKDVAKYADRNFYGYHVIMLYYRTSPLLIFPLSFYAYRFFNKKTNVFNFVMMGLYLFTLILSGTRANMLSGVIIIIYFLFDFLVRKKNKLPLIVVSVVALFAIVSFLKSLSFAETDPSTKVKSGHYDSYIVLFNNHPEYLIWGQGLGSKFYTQGLGIDVNQTELTYFDLVRWFGLPLALVLIALLLYPIIYMYFNKIINNNNRYLIAAYLGYLFIAGTNPLLVSSTGMLALLTIYSIFNYQDTGKKVPAISGSN